MYWKNLKNRKESNDFSFNCRNIINVQYHIWTILQDIAVLTNDATRCPYYKAESANVKPRFGCVMSSDFLVENFPRITLPNTKEACEVGQVAQRGENFIVYNKNSKKGKEIIIQILCKEKCVGRWGQGGSVM